ncbi:hypothetical protein Trydic_g16099 [Trypoxylus dichotomus]
MWDCKLASEIGVVVVEVSMRGHTTNARYTDIPAELISLSQKYCERGETRRDEVKLPKFPPNSRVYIPSYGFSDPLCAKRTIFLNRPPIFSRIHYLEVSSISSFSPTRRSVRFPLITGIPFGFMSHVDLAAVHERRSEGRESVVLPSFRAAEEREIFYVTLFHLPTSASISTGLDFRRRRGFSLSLECEHESEHGRSRNALW